MLVSLTVQLPRLQLYSGLAMKGLRINKLLEPLLVEFLHGFILFRILSRGDRVFVLPLHFTWGAELKLGVMGPWTEWQVAGQDRSKINWPGNLASTTCDWSYIRIVCNAAIRHSFSRTNEPFISSVTNCEIREVYINIVRVIKSKRTRWVEYEVHVRN
jgi:hypothetical protein